MLALAERPMVSKCLAVPFSSSRALPGREGLPGPSSPAPAFCAAPQEAMTSLWTASCWSPPAAAAPSFRHSFCSSLNGSALHIDASFKRGSSSKTLGISASRGKPSFPYSVCRSLDPISSSWSHCWARSAAVCILLNRFTGMPRASQPSAQAAMSRRSRSSARCCSELAPRPASVRKETESFMHSSLSSSTGMALQKMTRLSRPRSSSRSSGVPKAEEGRPMPAYSRLSTSASRASRRSTSRMAPAAARMLPSLLTGTSPRLTQASAHLAIVRRSANSQRFSSSLMPPPRPPFETLNSWHSLRSSLRGSPRQQAAHLRRPRSSVRSLGGRPASGGRPRPSYSILKAASSMASSCVTRRITALAASASPILLTGMPRSSQRAASQGVRHMPVTSSSTSCLRRWRSGIESSRPSVGRPTLPHSSRSSATGISCQMETAFNWLSSSALLDCSSASRGRPSASCSASSSSSESCSRRWCRAATCSASLGPSCSARMPRASQCSRHMAQTKRYWASSCLCSPFLT
mmetsp:Transcript_116685/g.341582  ORF Transcript_116685/g.341582 Transcript_116685/m.341582 type:complete len:520 (-) Transcript_116685:364-1923(-)